MRDFHPERHLALGVAAMTALVLGGCSEATTPVTPAGTNFLWSDNENVVLCDNSDVEEGKFKLTKEGGQGTFEVVIAECPGCTDASDTPGDEIDSFTAILEAGECALIHTNFSTVGSQTHIVTVTETSGNFESVQLTIITNRPEAQTITTFPPDESSATVTALVGGLKGAIARYRNSPPPPPPDPGLAGCTPGFWKQPHHFEYWTAPYVPEMLFVDAGFVDAFPGKTLLQVVSQGGGGLKALGRHTVAALLNAASGEVDYGTTPADVIDAFNAAYASGNDQPQKNAFEQLNELGCTVDKSN